MTRGTTLVGHDRDPLDPTAQMMRDRLPG